MSTQYHIVAVVDLEGKYADTGHAWLRNAQITSLQNGPRSARYGAQVYNTLRICEKHYRILWTGSALNSDRNFGKRIFGVEDRRKERRERKQRNEMLWRKYAPPQAMRIAFKPKIQT